MEEDSESEPDWDGDVGVGVASKSLTSPIACVCLGTMLRAAVAEFALGTTPRSVSAGKVRQAYSTTPINPATKSKTRSRNGHFKGHGL